ncbi:hypothetical protein B0O99DRAFT_684133 [Bisporella sp. PMI_857]|nr:hypothetical protein B0O99DRAFT_684133 [Bisporella sp. PMI_857]
MSCTPDFRRALSFMREHQQAIYRLTTVVTAIISIENSRLGQDEAGRDAEESRRAQEDYKNVALLTRLATVFSLLSYVASLRSMQKSVCELKDTYKLYFETALPLALALGLLIRLNLPSVREDLGARFSKGRQTGNPLIMVLQTLHLLKREPEARSNHCK